MPTLPHTLSRHRYNRIVAAIPRLEAVLHDLDAIDRKTPLAPGFAGPRRRVVAEFRALLGKTPFHVLRRPLPVDLFTAALDTYAVTHLLFRHLKPRQSPPGRHTYPRSSGEE
jgi:hypothetical protein